MEVIVANHLESVRHYRRTSGMERQRHYDERSFMIMCSSRARLSLALCMALFAVSAFAQFQTGNIYGRVQARDGTALRCVTVTLTGVGAPQTTITGPQGDFRFPNLSPGTYNVKAELAGFGTAARAGVGGGVGANAHVPMTMNPSVTES